MTTKVNLLDPEHEAAMVANRVMAPEGECSICDRYRYEFGNAAGPSHTPSSTCRSGGRKHCSCSGCY